MRSRFFLSYSNRFGPLFRKDTIVSWTMFLLVSLVLSGCNTPVDSSVSDLDPASTVSADIGSDETTVAPPIVDEPVDMLESEDTDSEGIVDDDPASDVTDLEDSASSSSAVSDTTDQALVEDSIPFIAEDHLDSFLYQYFDLLNQGQYEKAWASLGPEMQSTSPYDSYVDWWHGIRRADVQAINHIYADDTGGEVMTQVVYDKGSGSSSSEVLVMQIGSLLPEGESDAEIDAAKGDWLIQSVAIADAVDPSSRDDYTPLTPTSALVIDGIGSIRVGMTLQEAANATGLTMATRGTYGHESCDYYEAIGSPSGISFMVSYGRIVRVDIDNPGIKTRSGAGIGTSLDRIKALYPGKIEESDHQYVTGGKYLRFVPEDAADQKYRILFETDEEGQVTRFRSGFEDEVGYVEGCS